MNKGGGVNTHSLRGMFTCIAYRVICAAYCVICAAYCAMCTAYCVICAAYCVICAAYCVCRILFQKREIAKSID